MDETPQHNEDNAEVSPDQKAKQPESRPLSNKITEETLKKTQDTPFSNQIDNQRVFGDLYRSLEREAALSGLRESAFEKKEEFTQGILFKALLECRILLEGQKEKLGDKANKLQENNQKIDTILQEISKSKISTDQQRAELTQLFQELGKKTELPPTDPLFAYHDLLSSYANLKQELVFSFLDRLDREETTIASAGSDEKKDKVPLFSPEKLVSL